MARAKTKKKAASRISKRAEGHIVAVSLENPDFGALEHARNGWDLAISAPIAGLR